MVGLVSSVQVHFVGNAYSTRPDYTIYTRSYNMRTSFLVAGAIFSSNGTLTIGGSTAFFNNSVGNYDDSGGGEVHGTAGRLTATC